MELLKRNSIIAFVVAAIYVAVIMWIGYKVPRDDFNSFILLFLAGFACFYGLYLNKQKWNFLVFAIIAILLRLALLFAAPELSNDFYRFIWDGELITRGINPYAHIPNELISQGPLYTDPNMRLLYHGMGELSQANYTVYPVFNQLLFYLPAKLFDSIQANVISLKLIVILADIGSIYVGRKILQKLNKPTNLIWLYALNPFVILEFSGNLHFEGVMIFFMLLAFWYVLNEKWVIGAVFFGLAIQVKLIPLMLLPFIVKHLKWRKGIGFAALSGVVVLLLFTLMVNEELWANIQTSLDLYFQNFEFNASIFYIARAYSFASVGYDDIAFWGPFLSKIATVLIVILTVVRKSEKPVDLFTGMLFIGVIYYTFATTVHPWYISTFLAISIFTRYKFMLVWSLLIMLTYYAYGNPGFQENPQFIILEYVLVFGIMIIEIFRNTDKTVFGIEIKRFLSNE